MLYTMVPWPIAMLTLLYGAVATASAVSVWKAATGLSRQSPLWPLVWLAVSASATCGLPLLKPWGRRLAMCTSVLLLAVTLAIAGLLVMAGRPLAGLLAALLAGSHAVIIRYLQRPATKAYFGFRNADCGLTDHQRLGLNPKSAIRNKRLPQSRR